MGERFAIVEERLGRVLVGFMALGFVALLAAGLAAWWASARNAEHTRWVAHTYEVEIAVGTARRLIEQAETTRRGYLLAPATPTFLVSYREAAAQLGGAMRRLRALTADNPRQQRQLDALDTILRTQAALRERSLALVARGAVVQARGQFVDELSATRLRLIRRGFDALAGEERRLLVLRDAELKRSETIFQATLAIAALLLLGVGVASLLVVRGSTRAIAASRDALRGINETLEERVTERTADLTRANEEIQRFAYIVSHDLRSPLVNVMGFTAELEAATASVRALIDRAEAEAPQIVTDEARFAAREDLPEAIGFIRSSTHKMDRLINAILTLSRQGRRVLTPEPLDLAAIVAGVRESLAKRLDDEGGTVSIEGDLPPIVSDRLGIEQVLSNLIENAVKYRQPGRPVAVTVRGRAERGRVVIEVADNGRGIDPRDHDRVFDLFRRSGKQDQPGEGIGLAHVRALMLRLGGTIGVTSTLGEGAVFRLSLPDVLQLRESQA